MENNPREDLYSRVFRYNTAAKLSIVIERRIL